MTHRDNILENRTDYRNFSKTFREMLATLNKGGKVAKGAFATLGEGAGEEYENPGSSSKTTTSGGPNKGRAPKRRTSSGRKRGHEDHIREDRDKCPACGTIYHRLEGLSFCRHNPGIRRQGPRK